MKPTVYLLALLLCGFGYAAKKAETATQLVVCMQNSGKKLTIEEFGKLYPQWAERISAEVSRGEIHSAYFLGEMGEGAAFLYSAKNQELALAKAKAAIAKFKLDFSGRNVPFTGQCVLGAKMHQ